MSVFGLWLRLEFVPRDAWVGAYVTQPYWEMGYRVYGVYVCVLPCFPLLISWRLRGKDA